MNNITRDQMPSMQQANYPGRRYIQMQELLNNRISATANDQTINASQPVGMNSVQQQSVWK